jgi:putative DNA primase/helicase
VPFRVQFKEDQQDKGLKKRLIDNEIDGVFAWLVEGAREYLRKGLAPPEVIREAVNAYRAEANPFGEWYRECCILDPDAEEPAQDLFASYCEWCELQGCEPVKQAAFGRSLATKQHPKGKANVEGRRGVIVRKGLRLDNIRVLEITADLAAKRAAEGSGSGGRKRGGEDMF